MSNRPFHMPFLLAAHRFISDHHDAEKLRNDVWQFSPLPEEMAHLLLSYSEELDQPYPGDPKDKPEFIEKLTSLINAVQDDKTNGEDFLKNSAHKILGTLLTEQGWVWAPTLANELNTSALGYDNSFLNFVRDTAISRRLTQELINLEKSGRQYTMIGPNLQETCKRGWTEHAILEIQPGERNQSHFTKFDKFKPLLQAIATALKEKGLSTDIALPVRKLPGATYRPVCLTGALQEILLAKGILTTAPANPARQANVSIVKIPSDAQELRLLAEEICNELGGPNLAAEENRHSLRTGVHSNVRGSERL